ncbi:MAG: TolC family protein, partial [Eubacteriales bacterium]
MRKRVRFVALFTVLVMLVNVPLVFADSVTDQEKVTLEFDNIQALVEKENANVLISQLTEKQLEASWNATLEAKESISDAGKTYLQSARDTMIGAINSVDSSVAIMSSQLASLGSAPASPTVTDPEVAAVLTYMDSNFVKSRDYLAASVTSLSSTRESLTGQLNQIEASLEQLDEGLDNGEKAYQRQAEDLQETLNKAKIGTEATIDSVTWGAECAYMGYYTLGHEITKLDEAIKMLNLNLMAVKLQKELGMVSQLEVVTAETTLNTTINARQALLDQQKELLNQINLLIGRKYSAELELAGLPEVDTAEISKIAVSYEKDLQSVFDNSTTLRLGVIDIRMKEHTLTRAEEDDGSDSDNYLQAEKALYITKNDQAEDKRQLENTFFQLYKDIISKQRDLVSEESTLKTKEFEYQNAEAKYDQGQISYIDYSKVDSEYNTQQEIVKSRES